MRFICLTAALALSGSAAAAPMLRLSNAAVVSQFAPGAAPATQTIQACNQGDGALSLMLSNPNVPWLTASLGPPSTCIPLNFTITPGTLPRGTYTATVTVSDPHAIDAPQTITVTMEIGIQPTAIDQYLPPGGEADVALPNPCPSFFSYNCGSDTATTQDGAHWLAIVAYGGGTLPFLYDYFVHIAPPSSMVPGTYFGSISASSAGLTQNIPVTLHLTTQPIAVPSVSQLSLEAAQNGPALAAPFLLPISFTNAGQGTLAIQGATATGPGLIAAVAGNLVSLTLDPANLPPGTTAEALTIACNAVNCPLQIPVSLQIDPIGPPTAAYQGVVDNATFLPDQNLAPGDIAIIRGTQLSAQPPTFAPSYPLPITLGGASILVNNVYAPLYYTSAGQIAFQLPAATAAGPALVQVVRDSQPGNLVGTSIVPVAPQIVTVTDAAFNPLDLTHPAHPGQSIILWVIGLGATDPSVPDGTAAPASPPAVSLHIPTVHLGAESVTPSFAGLAPGYAGLYQINLALPPDTPSGTLRISLDFVLYSVQITVE